MRKLHQPIWHEGALLSQQHFQQWQHYLEDQMQAHWQLTPFCWGVMALEIDDGALLAGRFRVKQCDAMFPQGQMISFNQAMDGELCFDLNVCESSSIPVYLCLPLATQVKGLSGYDMSGDRFGCRAVYQQIADDYDPERKREVTFASPHLLLSQVSSLDEVAALQIAVVKRTGHQQYVLDADFIAPCLSLGASPAMMRHLNYVMDCLEAKLRQSRASQFAQDDVSHRLLLRSIAEHLPMLRHYSRIQKVHPIKVYEVLLRLIGSLEETLGPLEDYRHDHLAEVFSAMQIRLQACLDKTLLLKTTTLSFQKESDAIYRLEAMDEVMLVQHTFYLAVKYDDADMSWIQRFLERTKISSKDALSGIVGSAVSGVVIQHATREVDYLSTKQGCEYFRLVLQGDFWAQVKTDKTLAVFVSHEFVQAQLEMIVMRNE
jgi:type VI secretion system protein ImpJ